MAVGLTLRCPECKGEIQVASIPSLEEKTAECPHCKKKQKIASYLPKICLRKDSHRFQLRFGEQWIGRKAESGTAEVQIPDDTNYMSKRHAIVNVWCSDAGLRCTFEEHGKNPTHIQNVPLINDDIIYLNVGDCLELGGQKMYLASEFE